MSKARPTALQGTVRLRASDGFAVDFERPAASKARMPEPPAAADVSGARAADEGSHVRALIGLGETLDAEVDIPDDAWPEDAGDEKNLDPEAVLAGKRRMLDVLERFEVFAPCSRHEARGHTFVTTKWECQPRANGW